MKKLLLAGVAIFAIAGQANAAVNFGIFGDSTAAAAAKVTAQGYGATQLANLSNLSGINVLWVLNGNNGGRNINAAQVSSFVSNGGVLIYNDRSVTDAAQALPGASGITFVRNFANGANIDIANAIAPITNGPGGAITNATLDGGNSSNHGYALLGTLPAGATAVFSNNVAGDHIVDFFYSQGAGKVYYSSIPLDFYLAGIGTNGNSFRNIYTPNLIAQGASLAAAVPEPASWALMIAGFGLAGAAMRRRQTVSVTYA